MVNELLHHVECSDRVVIKQLEWTHFRSGWTLAYHLLKSINIKCNAVLFANIDYQAQGLTNGSEPFPWHMEDVPNSSWAGIVHGPLSAAHDLIASEWWTKAHKLCRGLFSLTQSISDELHSATGLPVQTLYVPFERPSVTWSKAEQYITVGNAFRDTSFIESLPYNIKSINCFNDDRMANDEYDLLLSRSVVVVKLTSAVVANIMIDCMASKTPLIINRNEASEDYLGVEYPLFYHDYDSCVAALADIERHHLANEYLCDRNMSRHSEDAFRDTLVTSSIWDS